jgi:hypothetical protein
MDSFPALTPEQRAIFAEYDAHVAQIVRDDGVFIHYVSGHEPVHESPCFAYTVGLHDLGHPELLAFELPAQTMAAILNDLSARVRAGERLRPGQPLSFSHWPHRVVPEVDPNPGQIAFQANDYYRLPPFAGVDLLQLTYDDREGRFPWDAGYATAAWIQPRPGEFCA